MGNISKYSYILQQYKQTAVMYPTTPPIAIAGSRHYHILPSTVTPFIVACIGAGVPALNIGCANGVDYSILCASIAGGLPVNYYTASGKLPFNTPLLTLKWQAPSNITFSQQLAARTQRCVQASCMLVVFQRSGQPIGKGTQLAINTAGKGGIPVHYIK